MNPSDQNAHCSSPVRLFATITAFESFAENVHANRIGLEEVDLVIDEIGSFFSQSASDDPGWLRSTYSAVNCALPELHRRYLSELPALAGTYRQYLSHWLLRDAWGNPESREFVRPMLSPYGFSAAFLLLAVENCIHTITYSRSVPALDALEEQASAMRLALMHYGRAALSLGFLFLVIPHESESLVAQNVRKAQHAGQEGYEILRNEALELWRIGLAEGRWRRSGKGNGPRKASIQIAMKLQERAKSLLTGKKALRGIAAGGHDRIYNWILEDL